MFKKNVDSGWTKMNLLDSISTSPIKMVSPFGNLRPEIQSNFLTPVEIISMESYSNEFKVILRKLWTNQAGLVNRKGRILLMTHEHVSRISLSICYRWISKFSFIHFTPHNRFSNPCLDMLVTKIPFREKRLPAVYWGQRLRF